MKIPIFNTLYYGTKNNLKSNSIDIKKLNNLKLELIKLKNFPSVKILKELPHTSSLYETILVTINDELVKKFLNRQIKFYQITEYLSKFLKIKEFEKYKSIKPKKIQEIIELSKYVRLKLRTLSI